MAPLKRCVYLPLATHPVFSSLLPAAAITFNADAESAKLPKLLRTRPLLDKADETKSKKRRSNVSTTGKETEETASSSTSISNGSSGSITSSTTSTAPKSPPPKKTNKTLPATPDKAKSKNAKETLHPQRDHRYISTEALKPGRDAMTVIASDLKLYTFLDGQQHNEEEDEDEITETINEQERPIDTVTLEYPGDNAEEVFPLVVSLKDSEYSPVHDLYTTVQMIVKECIPLQNGARFGDRKSGLVRDVMSACRKRKVADVQNHINSFNKLLGTLKEEGIFETNEITGEPASGELTHHILEQAYARAVAPEAHTLRQYQGFSNNVYGEIRQNFVNDIIKVSKLQSHHTFLDMGSGIGNVVLQVAAQVLCESIGVEIMEKPADLAEAQKIEFLSRMRYYAKPCGKILLKKADFLEDPEIQDAIRRADVIFVNNYAFSPELNQAILHKFLDLKESCKVISLWSFLPVDRRPSLHRSNAIESIFKVKELYFGRESVSWMNEPGKYYLHTVNRKQLEAFH